MLVEELLEQTQGESELTPVQERAAFEKVLGERRGHIRGVGRKPSALPPIPQPSQPSQQSSQPSQVKQSTLVFVPSARNSNVLWFFL